MMKSMLEISGCIPTIGSMGNADPDEVRFDMKRD